MIFLMNVLYSECIFHVIISICATMHAFIPILYEKKVLKSFLTRRMSYAKICNTENS